MYWYFWRSKTQEIEKQSEPDESSSPKPKRIRRTKQQMIEASAKAADAAVASILSRALDSQSSKTKKDSMINNDEKGVRGRKRSTKQILTRECLICNSNLHQDELVDHYTKHFSQSPKCCECKKISSNPANFITHILSHLRMCVFPGRCLIWVMILINCVFKRHSSYAWHVTSGFANHLCIRVI